jgi:hypothetical protein
MIDLKRRKAVAVKAVAIAERGELLIYIYCKNCSIFYGSEEKLIFALT